MNVNNKGGEIEVSEYGNGDEEEEEDLFEDNERRAEYVFELGVREGHLEAPIDLNISTMTSFQLDPLMWYNHDIPPKKIKLMNTGATVIMNAKWQKESPYLMGGPFLDDKYVFSQLHFHWGKNEMIGSEHYLDGCCMPMELHAVHFKADYRSLEEARRQPDGIVILAYLFRLQPGPNEALEQVVENLARIREPGESVRVKSCRPLVELLRPFSDDYFLYWGALVTADTEVSHRVLWLVTRAPIPISQEQIAHFRLLVDSRYEPLLHNCRPLKERAGRNVLHVNPSGNASSSLLLITREPAPLTANQIEEVIARVNESDKQKEASVELHGLQG